MEALVSAQVSTSFLAVWPQKMSVEVAIAWSSLAELLTFDILKLYFMHILVFVDVGAPNK